MQTATTATSFTLVDPDGFEVSAYRWDPEPGVLPKAALQIAHGATEHAQRYEPVARFFTEAGFVVYTNDHRGHGKTAGSLDRLGRTGPDGWNAMVRDTRQLTEHIRQEHPNLPVFLLGHSMGSFIAQQYIQQWGNELNGVVLSGTTGELPDLDMLVAAAETAVNEQGAQAPSALFQDMFASFNSLFAPGEPGFEWLSRDAAEVQKYVNDSWCGFAFSNGLLTDLLRGIEQIWKAENEQRIPKNLPVLMVVGEQDPAGGFTQSVRSLVDRYRGHGIEDLTCKIYPGARHEVLNETNRDEVLRDVLAWLERHL